MASPHLARSVGVFSFILLISLFGITFKLEAQNDTHAPGTHPRAAHPPVSSTNEKGDDSIKPPNETIVPFAVFSVTNTNDSGAGSLRQALTTAVASTGPHVIDAGGVTGTISLQSALPTITNTNITINGPTSGTLTITRGVGTAFRIFTVTNASGAATLTLNNLTMTNGNTGGADSGGGIRSDSSTLNLNYCTISGCVAENSALTKNGGGLFASGNGTTVNINFCAFTNNQSDTGGGISVGSGAATGTVTINNSTISGNQALTGNGGGLQVASLTANLNNCTISGNTSAIGGGGMIGGSASTVNLRNCTVTNNTGDTTNSGSLGGGIRALGSQTFSISNTIVTGNFQSNPPVANDITWSSAATNKTSTNSTVGILAAGQSFNTTTASFIGNPTTPVVVNLGSLANNGGPTQTHALLVSSPERAINLGSNTLVNNLASDQRGIGFNRISGGTVDMGAVESGSTSPSFTGVTPLGAPAQITGVTTLSYTVPPGTNRLLVVTASNASNTAQASVSFGGTPMTLAIQRDDTFAYDSIFYLALGTGTSATSGNVVVTGFATTANTVLTAQTFQNVNQTTPIDGTGSNQATGTNLGSSVTINTTTAGDVVFDIFDCFLGTNTISSTPGAGQAAVNKTGLSIVSPGTGFAQYTTSAKPATGASTSTSWTSNTEAILHLAVNINQATAGTTVSSINRVGGTSVCSGASVSWTVTFAASVTGLTTSNFALANTGLTSPTITGVSGSGTTWTVTASTGTGSGSLGLNMTNATGVTPTVTNLPFTGQVFTVNANPTAFNVTGGGSVCSGGPGVAVGLNGSQTGVNYQLFNGASPVGSPVAGTGSAISFGSQTTAGTYTVTATNATTSCTANMTGSAVVTVNPAPTAFNVTGGGSFCSGGTGVAVGLSGSQTGVNYQLFNGASPVGSPVAGTGSALSFGNQTTAGTYTVVATNATTSCTANMTGSAVVTVNATPTAFNVTGGGSFCSGGTGVAVGLSGSQTGVNYQLFNGASPVGSPVAGTGSAISFGNQTTAGTYTVTATNGTTSCTANMTGSAVVTVNANPTAFNVTGGGSFCSGGTGVAVGLSGSQTGVNYQLFNGASPVGSPVAGTGSAISFGNQTTAGTYTVVATNATTSCTANMTGSAVVTVNSNPTAFNVTGGGTVCSGGPGVAVGLNGSQTGVNYQLFNGASTVGSPVAGTGSAISFGNQTAAGTYTVVATNTTTSCTSNMTGSAVVTVSSLVVTNGNDSGAGSLRQAIADACAGSTLTFQAGVTTVTLTTAELAINKNLTIDGGTGVTVTRQGGSPNFRIFNVLSGNTVSMNNLTVTNGNAPIQAGGIQNSGTLTLTNCAISGNTAPQGGGVQNDDTLTMTGCVISGNSASGGGGGGIAIFGASTTVTDCEVSGNTATGGGGGILHGGTLLNLTNCTISGNTTTGLTGGGIFNGGSSNLTNCTITGNAATGTSSGGGGMSNSGSSNLTNCTITGNTASLNGGGILIFNNATGPTTLRNTIVAQNTASSSANIFGTVNTASFNNLIGVGGTGGLANGVNGNLVSVTTPLLAALGSNGGPTQTIGLLPGSPAINAGTATSAPTADQRGVSRVGNVDIGAFESRGFTLAVASGDNQIANVTTAFASPLAVTVSSSFSEPVNGGRITFTPPGSGASAGIAGNPATIVSGTATTGTVTANGAPGGPYSVAVGGNGVTTGVNFSLTNACPTITAFNVTGGGSFCTGGTGVTVGLSGSQTGVNYRLFNGASPVGGSVAGTGSALNFGNQTTAGTYTVVATFGSTGCTANMTGSATVNINPTPGFFNVTGGGSFCSGGVGVAVGLSGSQTGVNYQLFNGASPVGSPVAGTGSALNFGNQTTAGTYTVVATNATTSCTANMTGSAIVTVNPSPTAFNVTGGGSFCSGSGGVAVGLSGSETGVNYQLFNGASPVGSPVAGTGSALSFGIQTTGGTYTVVATNATTSCTANMTGSATITVTNCAPTVTTSPATGVSTTGATLNGSVNANGDSTTVLFRYGTTAGGPYPNSIAATPSPVTGTTPTAITATVSGLTANQVYYFIAEGTNGSGTTQGNEQSFSTATCTFSLSAPSANFPASGGNGTVTITTTAGCAWNVSGIPTWISNVSPASGTGTTAITFTVAPNQTEISRSATLTIGGESYTVNQDAAVAINSLIGFSVVSQTAGPPSCSPTYANDYTLVVNVSNNSTQTIYTPYFQVVELQEAAGSAPPAVPFRLVSADGATCSTGGLVGSVQSTDGQTTPTTLPTLAPGQSVTIRFVIALPSLRRFRFVVSGGGSTTAPVSGLNKGVRTKSLKAVTPAMAEHSGGMAFLVVPSPDGKRFEAIPVQPELEGFLNLGDDFWTDLNQTLLANRGKAKQPGSHR